MKIFLSSQTRRWFTSLALAVVLSIAALVFSAAAARPRLATVGRVAGNEQLPRAPIYTTGSFTFAAPQQMPKSPLSPIFFQQDGEPEIKADLFGNIYITAINGVPGGTDLWKSVNQGGSFAYLGQPDGLQDKCADPLAQCAGAGGADDSIDVSTGGYL